MFWWKSHLLLEDIQDISLQKWPCVFFLCSVLPYRSRCEQPVPAGGQCVYRGLSDCAGHTQHLHHGIQGIGCNAVDTNDNGTRHFCILIPFLLVGPHVLLRLSWIQILVTTPWWRKFSRSICASCRSLSLRPPSNRSSPPSGPSSTRWKTREWLGKVEHLFYDLFLDGSICHALHPVSPHATSSSPVPSLMAGPTCVPLCATKSSSAVTPSWAQSAATPPIFSTSSWKATLTILDASLLYEHTCRYVCRLACTCTLLSMLAVFL